MNLVAVFCCAPVMQVTVYWSCLYSLAFCLPLKTAPALLFVCWCSNFICWQSLWISQKRTVDHCHFIYKNIGNLLLWLARTSLQTWNYRCLLLWITHICVISYIKNKLHYIDQHLIGYQSVGHFGSFYWFLRKQALKLVNRKFFVSHHAKRCHRKNIQIFLKPEGW